MDEWWRQQIASGFAAFRGAQVSGSVPISDRLLNELMQQWLATAAAGRVEAGPRDVEALARLVRRVSVAASEGVLTVEFEVGV